MIAEVPGTQCAEGCAVICRPCGDSIHSEKRYPALKGGAIFCCAYGTHGRDLRFLKGGSSFLCGANSRYFDSGAQQQRACAQDDNSEKVASTARLKRAPPARAALREDQLYQF